MPSKGHGRQAMTSRFNCVGAQGNESEIREYVRVEVFTCDTAAIRAGDGGRHAVA